MISLILDNQAAIRSLCQKYHVARLEVFGSAVGGDFDASRSDVDFLVEFHSAPEMGAADQYFGLLEELQGILSVRVDLVCARAMRNRFFIRSVNATRKELYAA